MSNCVKREQGRLEGKSRGRDDGEEREKREGEKRTPCVSLNFP